MAVAVCYNGDLGEGERLLAPLRAFGPPMADLVQPMPMPVMQTLFDAAVPEGNQNYWKSAFLRELSDDAIATIVEHTNRATSPLTAVLVEQYGGTAGRVGPTDTAFAQRHVQYDLGILTQWTDAADSARHIAWTRGFAEAMKPFGTGRSVCGRFGGLRTVLAIWLASFPL